MKIKQILLLIILSCSFPAWADNTEITAEEAVKIIQGEEPNPLKIFQLALTFDEGPGSPFYCHAKYLYYLTSQKSAQTPQEAEVIEGAKRRLEEMKKDGLKCTIALNTSPSATLENVLSQASSSPLTDGRGGSKGAPRGNVPSQGQHNPTGFPEPQTDAQEPQTVEPVRTKAPVDPIRNTGIWKKPPPTEKIPVNRTPEPVNDTIKQAAGPVTVGSSNQECARNGQLLAKFYPEALGFSMLSLLAYDVQFDVDRLYLQIQKENELLDAIEGDSARSDYRKQQETARVGNRIAEIQKTIFEKEEEIRNKQLYLLATDLRPLTSLMTDFQRYTNASDDQLESSGFWADGYELPTGLIAIVFRGTANNPGVITDAAQLVGLQNIVYNGSDDNDGAIGQYGQADALIRMLLAKGYSANQIIVAGHSLGGGLASYVLSKHNLLRGYGYNAAELGPSHRAELAKYAHHDEASQRMMNFISYSEVVNGADPVSQGSIRLSEIANVFGVSIKQLGRLVGPTYYIPIVFEEMPLGWAGIASNVAKAGAGAGAMGLKGSTIASITALASLFTVKANKGFAVGTEAEAKHTNQELMRVGGVAAGVGFKLYKKGLMRVFVGGTLGGAAGYAAGHAAAKMVYHEWALHTINHLNIGMLNYFEEGPQFTVLQCANPKVKIPKSYVEYQSLKDRFYTAITSKGGMQTAANAH